MIKILFLFLLSFNLFGQSFDYGYYWFKNGSESVKATGSAIAGYYDPKKPTIIYFHGWQPNTSVDNYRREKFIFVDPTQRNASVDTANKWIADGWNVGIFYWNQFADEDEVTNAEAKIWSINGPQKMRYRLNTGAFSTSAMPTSSIGDLAYNEYIKIMANHGTSEIRFAGHSLGSQLAVRTAKKLSDANSKLMPKRLELLDPFWSKNGKSWLGDTVNGTVTVSSCEKPVIATNPAWSGNGNDWTGEVARCYIAKMIAKNSIAVTWLKTSLIGDVGVGDANSSLRPLTVFMNVKSGWWGSDKQTDKHMWAKNIYFWSKIVPSNAINIPSYANTPYATVRANMKKTYSQKAGIDSANPSDDTY